MATKPCDDEADCGRGESCVEEKCSRRERRARVADNVTNPIAMKLLNKWGPEGKKIQSDDVYQKAKKLVSRWKNDMGSLGAKFEERWNIIRNMQGDPETLAEAVKPKSAAVVAGAMFISDDPEVSVPEKKEGKSEKVKKPEEVEKVVKDTKKSKLASKKAEKAEKVEKVEEVKVKEVEQPKEKEKKKEKKEKPRFAPEYLSKPVWGECDVGTLQPFQLGFKQLIESKPPNLRLLIAADTGMGKTLMMILAMEAYFRKKQIVVFIPNSTVKRNLFDNLIRFPNKFKTAFGWEKGTKYDQVEADLKSLCSEKEQKARDKEEKGEKGEKKGGMKGGKKGGKKGEKGDLKRRPGDMRVWIVKYTQPSIALKIKGEEPENPLGDKAIIADEFHNLFPFGFGKLRYPRQLEIIREIIAYTLPTTPLYAFTATPFGSNFYHDVLKVLRVVRGRSAKAPFKLPSFIEKVVQELREQEQKPEDEESEEEKPEDEWGDEGKQRGGQMHFEAPVKPGRISKEQRSHLKRFRNLVYYLNIRPPTLFAQCIPPVALNEITSDFRPDMHLPDIVRVDIGTVVGITKANKIKISEDGPGPKQFVEVFNKHIGKGSETVLHYAYPYQTSRPPPPKPFLDQWNDGKGTDLVDLSPKLDALVTILRANPKLKTLILCSRRGLDIVNKVLSDTLSPKTRKCVGCYHYFQDEAQNLAETDKIKKQIEDISRASVGEDGHVTLANSRVYGEGFDWLGIDHLILLSVPLTTTMYVQNIGRVFRLCNAMRNGVRRQIKVTMLMAALKGQDTLVPPLTPDRILVQRLSKGLADRRTQCKTIDSLSVVPLDFWDMSVSESLQEPERSEAWFQHDTERADQQCMWRKGEDGKDVDDYDENADDSEAESDSDSDEEAAAEMDKGFKEEEAEELSKVEVVFPDLSKDDLEFTLELLEHVPPPSPPAALKKGKGDFYSTFDLNAVLQTVASDAEIRERLTTPTGKSKVTFLGNYDGDDIYQQITSVYKESKDYFNNHKITKEHTNFGGEVIANVFDDTSGYEQYLKLFNKLSLKYNKLKDQRATREKAVKEAQLNSADETKKLIDKLKKQLSDAKSTAAKAKKKREIEAAKKATTQGVKRAKLQLQMSVTEIKNTAEQLKKTAQQLVRTNEQYANKIQNFLDKNKAKKAKVKPEDLKYVYKGEKDKPWTQTTTYKFNGREWKSGANVWVSSGTGNQPPANPTKGKTFTVIEIYKQRDNGQWVTDDGKVWKMSKEEAEEEEEGDDDYNPDESEGDDSGDDDDGDGDEGEEEEEEEEENEEEDE